MRAGNSQVGAMGIKDKTKSERTRNPRAKATHFIQTITSFRVLRTNTSPC